MADTPLNDQERLAELRDTGQAIAKLAADEAAFTRAAEAFRALDRDAFQAELSKAQILQHCGLICRWFCSKHCIFVCMRLCKQPPVVVEPADQIKEMLEFAGVTARIAADEELLKAFMAAVDAVDDKAFSALIKKLKLERFCHQICHFICTVRCQRVCRWLCPPPPLITEVGFIPTSRIDALGRATGPSFPPGTTPADNKPAGIGDHPFGGIANIRGVFNVAGAFQYKVEYSLTPVGPWTPILTPINDYQWNFGPPPPPPPFPPFIYYTRLPAAGGWYNVSEMGLIGPDYLTDWDTPADRDQLYYLKLTVRNAALVEFESPAQPVRVDNGLPLPTPPLIDLALQMPDGTRRKLGCCESISRGDGNLLVVTLQAWDENFSAISVNLIGGCGVSVPLVSTTAVPLSKTYNGNVADTGYPLPTDFLVDPWSLKVDPCCYLIYVTVSDRAIVNNFLSGAHSVSNWRSITIA